MEVKEFKVYSKEGCPYCTKIVSVLKLAKQPYVEYKLGRHFTRSEFYYHFGEGSSFPIVRYGDELIGGCVETVKYLKEQKLV